MASDHLCAPSAAPMLLANFLGLGYVTNNLDQALALFDAEFGISGWLETGLVTVDFGAERIAQLKIATLFVGDTLFEVQEPVSGDVDWYCAALPSSGFAIKLHHLGFGPSDSVAFDAMRIVVAREHPIVAEGRFISDSRYFLADARATLGHYLEYVELGAEFSGLIPRIDPPVSAARAGQLAAMNQVAYVTDDYDRALAVLRGIYGIEHFVETGRVTLNIGPPMDATLQVAQAYVGATQIELIAPLAGGVDVYLINGKAAAGSLMRMHHICFGCASAEALAQRLQGTLNRGDEIPLKGTFATESGYFYVDVRNRLGHHFEYSYLEAAVDKRIPRC